MTGLRWKTDDRPQRYGWAPGEYIGRCTGELCKGLEDRTYIGAKRSTMCADCAYALPWPPPPVDHVMNALAMLWVYNPDKVVQAKARPELRGWFVGQVMKELNGRADVDEVVTKVNQTFDKEIEGEESAS